MKRLRIAFVLAALTFPVGAADLVSRAYVPGLQAAGFKAGLAPILKQFVVVSPGGGSTITPGSTVFSTCTANTWAWFDSSMVFQCTAAPIIISDLTFTGQILEDVSTAGDGRRTRTASDTTPTTLTTWDARHSCPALSGTSSTSSGVCFSYDQTGNMAYMTTISPGVAVRPFTWQGTSFSFSAHNGSAFSGVATFAATGQVLGLNNQANAIPILTVQDNSTSVLQVADGGSLRLFGTVTAGGTTGNQTINKTAGTVNFAAAAATLTVTNSLVTANSIVLCVVRTNDGTATLKNVVPAAGSFVITLTAAATAETSVGFVVIDPTL